MASDHFGRRIRECERDLLDNAEPEIDAFITEMHDLLERDRGVHIVDVDRRGPESAFDLLKPSRLQTNVPSLQARQVAISAAITGAEALKRNPDQSGVAFALEAFRAGIPAITTDNLTPRRSIAFVAPATRRDHNHAPRWASDPEIGR